MPLPDPAGFLPLLWLLAFALALPPFLVLRELLRLRYLPGSTRQVAEDEVPAGLRQDWGPSLDALQSLGFAPVAWLCTEAPLRQAERRVWQALLRWQDGPTHAMLHPAMLPQPGHLTHLTLSTPRAEGQRLESLNGLRPFVVGQQRDTLFHDEGFQSPAELLRQHQTALQAWLGPGGATAHWPPEAWAEALDAASRHYPEDLEAQGLARRCPDGTTRLRLGAALAQSWKHLRHRKAWKQAIPVAQGEDPAGLATEVATYQRWRTQHEAQSSPWSRTVAFFASALIFALAFSSSGLIPELRALGVLMAALAFHELGHFLAMWAFGYRQTGVIFVPLLGALTHGQPPPGPAGQREAIVLAMGPFPGLLLGAAGLVAWAWVPGHGPRWWLEASVTLVALNAFNLLPVWPLDGGRLLALLVPRWAFATRALSLVGALALAWLFRDPPWLGALMLLLALVLPWSWRHQDRLGALVAAKGEGPWEDQLPRLLLALRRPPFGAMAYAAKHQWVDQALRAPEATRLGLGARLGWGLALLIGLLGPWGLLLWALPGLRPHF